ncbi:hypothetical protein [Halobellus sp. GM3]|uniref:hypothetical protein n=1 Tax=Halobellus sp. GM3 TaxID=3458410 RepID=UPI00403D5C96
MQARELAGPAVAFVLVVALVVGGAAALPFLVGGESPEVTNLAKQQTDLDGVTVPAAEASGSITMDEDAESKTVLVDRAHANDVSEDDLSPLLDALVENGHEIRFVTQERARGDEWNESLRDADAFVAANPTRPYTPAQLDGLRAFADAGGRVVLLSDPSSVSAGGLLGLVIQQTSSGDAALESSFGVSVRPGYLFNMEEYQQNYKSVYAAPEDGSLSEGVDRVVFRDAVAVSTAGGQTALATDERTRLSTTRRADSYAVAVQSGDAAMVGDTDFLAPENAYVADNEAFIGNLADFLVGGEKTANAPGSSDAGGRSDGGMARPTPTPIA